MRTLYHLRKLVFANLRLGCNELFQQAVAKGSRHGKDAAHAPGACEARGSVKNIHVVNVSKR